VIATFIGQWFRSEGLRDFAVSILYVYIDAALLAFGIFLVSMFSGWLIFPLMIWATKQQNQETEIFESSDHVSVYVLIYTIIAAVLVFKDAVGR
jgi:hypothetical protein